MNKGVAHHQCNSLERNMSFCCCLSRRWCPLSFLFHAAAVVVVVLLTDFVPLVVEAAEGTAASGGQEYPLVPQCSNAPGENKTVGVPVTIDVGELLHNSSSNRIASSSFTMSGCTFTAGVEILLPRKTTTLNSSSSSKSKGSWWSVVIANTTFLNKPLVVKSDTSPSSITDVACCCSSVTLSSCTFDAGSRGTVEDVIFHGPQSYLLLEDITIRSTSTIALSSISIANGASLLVQNVTKTELPTITASSQRIIILLSSVSVTNMSTVAVDGVVAPRFKLHLDGAL